MYRYEKGTIEMSANNKEWYESRGWRMTGETLKEICTNNGLESCKEYVVMKGGWTRTYSARDCGDHYIIARYSRYDRVEKDTLEITYDVEDR